MLKIFGKTKYDFLGKRQTALVISGILILSSLISLVLHGGPNYSIDFEGGLKIEIRVKEPEGSPPIDEEMVRNTLNDIGLGNSEVKMSRSATGEDIIVQLKEKVRYRPPEALIRGSLEAMTDPGAWQVVPNDQLDMTTIPDLSGVSYVAIETELPEKQVQTALDSANVIDPRLIEHQKLDGSKVWIFAGKGRDAASRFINALHEDYPEYKIDVRAIDRVGPRIGAELRVQAILAVLAALALVIFYLWWRFELLFGFAAVAALFHDVLITLGLFSVLDIEISIVIIGAFLTIVGYSLNDTIVVFDRIRENLKRYKGADYAKIINRSINDNLSRTVITSLTTSLVVLVLFFKGGEVLHDFSLALLIGIIIGTYSSVFVASPILIEWAERTGKMVGSKRKK